MRQDASHYVDLATVAQRLCMSKKTVRAHVLNPTNPLRAYRIGGRLYFLWDEVFAWVQEHAVVPTDLGDLVKDLLQ